MTCEELSGEYGAYSLGVAEDPERSEIAGHLARRCPDCVRGVRIQMAVVTAMSGMVPPVAPSRRLRSRVVGMVDRDTKQRLFGFVLPWAVSAVMAVVLLAVLLPSRHANTQLRQAMAILKDPATKEAAIGETAKVFLNASRGVVFMAASLPPIKADKTFELWFIPTKGNPVPAGTFHSEADATALHIRSGPVQAGTAAVAVTVEPAGGSPKPTSAPFLVIRL